MPWLPILPIDDETYQATVKAIAKRLPPAGGVIIIFVPEGDDYTPFYFSEHESWHKFGDETRVENPITYISLPAAYRKLLSVMEPPIRRAGKIVPGDMMLAIWIHPDAGVPLQKYMDMTGSQFPGTVRQ